MKKITKVTELMARGRRFHIIFSDGMYMAIEDKYIDEGGRLTRTLNGLQMNASKDLDTTIDSTRKQVEVDFLTSNGVDIMRALWAVFM